MKLLRPQYALFLLLLVLGISGCSGKKPVLVAPQQPAPPTTAPQPTPTPEPATASQPAEQPTETQPATSTTPATSAATTKPKVVKHPAAKKPTKTVVPADKGDKNDAPASASGGQISPGPTSADTSHGQTSTEQLLQSAEDNLNSLKRQLSKDEETMRAQIREFINQSKKATTENDLARAHTLAVKARLLSDELVRQR